MRREWPLERDGETLQYGFCIRHHGLNDILRRPDVVDEADTLPGQPGHLLPIAVGVGGRQEHVELAHFCLLPEKYRPPDHRKTVADSWDLGETVRPYIDHPFAHQPHRMEMRPFGAEERRAHRLLARALYKAPLVFVVDRRLRRCNEPRPDPDAVGTESERCGDAPSVDDAARGEYQCGGHRIENFRHQHHNGPANVVVAAGLPAL